MDEIIRHEGIVLSTNGELAHVEIVQTSACAACKAKSMCMSSESQQKYIDAVMLEPMKTGDRVEVEVRERLAWKAILLAYILPFVVMMAVIAVLDYARSYHRYAVALRDCALLHRSERIQAPAAEAVYVLCEEGVRRPLTLTEHRPLR